MIEFLGGQMQRLTHRFIGWTVLTISHGGNYDANNRKVKWGPFFDAGQRDLAYTAQPSASSKKTRSSQLGGDRPEWRRLTIPVRCPCGSEQPDG